LIETSFDANAQLATASLVCQAVKMAFSFSENSLIDKDKFVSGSSPGTNSSLGEAESGNGGGDCFHTGGMYDTALFEFKGPISLEKVACLERNAIHSVGNDMT
jgi:hypothetical protein